MKTTLGQHTVLRQDLRINPRLYQAMDLLYMPLLDLQQHLKQELTANPFLELLEPEEEEETPATLAEKKEASEPADREEINWEDILLDGFDQGDWRAPTEEREFSEPVSVQTRDLTSYLREQLQLLDLTDRQRLLVEEFLGNIGGDGYLSATLEEIVAATNGLQEEFAAEREAAPAQAPYTLEEAQAVLAVVQTLDPPGVGARDLRECLLLQLKDKGETGSLAYRLLDEAFDDLIAHRWSDLAKRLGLDTAEVQAAADEIAKLDPKPGLRFSSSEGDYIIPDLIVEKIDGKYRVFLNDTNLPRLRLSRAYQEVARDKKKFVGENREFITQRLNSAQWMIQAIEQRRQTMLKVMNFIVDRQHDFFEKGIEHLKPLTLREVAEVINMHESTVSRVTNEKYVQTPRGVLPLKFFFSSALSTTSGEDASARAIKAQIQKLVGDETPHDPLTDQQIVQKLRERGVRIARRTVAKYRDQLGILSARMRKRV
ncbi:MAG TPA: RNA polymerase factor sigma-54 [Gemmatimonadales bacterium]|nr:RNA polymerase factor sigma-54 [Gemmatimonadales bacterium]